MKESRTVGTDVLSPHFWRNDGSSRAVKAQAGHDKRQALRLQILKPIKSNKAKYKAFT